MADALREEMVALGRSLFDRGLSYGAAGNLSVRLDNGWLATPTNVSLGRLEPSELSLIDAQGKHAGGDRPTKEWPLHSAIYARRPDLQAVVHLHSTHAVAVACLADLPELDALPLLTPYYVIRVGHLPLVPYHPPGDPALAAAIGELATRHRAFLLANHGPLVGGPSLEVAVDTIEELEETARLYLLLRSSAVRALSREAVDELRRKFPS
jgi:ribulose-5-phosphate 4-epimerase/fuculose-1-phosphate aldolase